MSAASNDLTKLQSTTEMSWLDKLSCVGLLGGTTVSLVMQQAAFATVPLSVLLTLQIFSRQQKVNALVQTCQGTAQSIQVVAKDLDALNQQCEQTFVNHEQKLDTLTQENNKHNLESISIKERLDEQSQNLANHAGQLDALDETLSSLKEITAASSYDNQSASAEAHFNRGTHQEKLGHLEVAIEDYSQAINRSQDYAEAYLRRGLAKSKLGRKQSAVIDLNLATKHFFEMGDLDNYQRAKDIAANIHRINGEDVAEAPEGVDDDENRTPELVSINGLFG